MRNRAKTLFSIPGTPVFFLHTMLEGNMRSLGLGVMALRARVCRSNLPKLHNGPFALVGDAGYETSWATRKRGSERTKRALIEFVSPRRWFRGS